MTSVRGKCGPLCPQQQSKGLSAGSSSEKWPGEPECRWQAGGKGGGKRLRGPGCTCTAQGLRAHGTGMAGEAFIHWLLCPVGADRAQRHDRLTWSTFCVGPRGCSAGSKAPGQAGIVRWALRTKQCGRARCAGKTE